MTISLQTVAEMAYQQDKQKVYIASVAESLEHVEGS